MTAASNTPFYYANLLPPLLLAATALPGAPNILVGAAAAAHIFSRSEYAGRAVAAAASLILLSAWVPLPAACLLAGIYVTEAFLTDSLRLRAARIIAAALCMQIILFTLNHRINPPVLTGNNPLLAFILAFAALAGAGLGRYRLTADPLLCALLSLLLLAFALAVKLIAIQLGDYPQAVATVTAGFCIILSAVSLLVAPLLRDGGGFQSIVQAFALEIPLERWTGEVSLIANSTETAADFLTVTMHRLAADLPGVDGIAWQADNQPLQKIGGGNHPLRVENPPLVITFYMRRFASPWSWFNHYLLCRVVSEYYLRKQHEEEQRAQNLLQAVHQTGARITHDIKNILHALSALTTTDDSALVRRQLPILHRRLETALGKLRDAPDDGHPPMPAMAWWNEAQSRHLQTPAQFPPATTTALIPAALFDRALDNFLENALRKPALQESLAIRAELSAATGGAALRVTDNGAALSDEAVKKLFAAPLPSNAGFGVALYQLAQEAVAHRYRPLLEHNAAGKVVFVLVPVAAINDK